MSRDYKVYIEDILEACQKVQNYTAGMSYIAFVQDEKTIDAVIRNLEVIGEAIKRVPEEIKSRYPDLEWKKIEGLRNILIHEYFGVNIEIIWDVVQNKLHPLRKKVERILSE